MTVTNPYKNVWDVRKDHFGEELSKVGSAFVPTYLEMALRSQNTTKNLLQKARKLNSSGYHTEARATFQEAMSHYRISKSMMARHHEVLAKSH